MQRASDTIIKKARLAKQFLSENEKKSKVETGEPPSFKAELMPKKLYFRQGRDTKEVDNFSEGESGSEFPVRIKSLKRNSQIQRIIFLWKKAYKVAVVGAFLISASYALHQELLKKGSTKCLMGSKQHIIEMQQQK